jgi:hypothetical protein
MSQIIGEGGDTDTNAAIAGGLIGALVGIKNLHKTMVKKILSFDCTSETAKKKRPEFLSTKLNLMKNIKKLIEIMPTDQL